jgi:serine/threonine-protein kinase
VTDQLRERLQASLGSAYVLERELGGGGMSRVFVAHDTSLGRKVVVKVLPAETAGAVSLERFKREIQLAARLQHPHIIPLLSAGDSDGIPYYTMPYVSDETLRTRIARGDLSLSEAVRTLREIASALAFAHREGVVHRDIKPDNVLLSGGVAAVTDFGVAKAVSAASTLSEGQSTGGLTSFGIALGTPAYISPEQASAEPDVDHRADIYSLGCVAYELICGTPPFAGRGAAKLMAAHVNEMPEPIAKRRADVPGPLAALVMRCLAKRPDDRPQSAEEIVHALDDLTTPSGGRSAVSAGMHAGVLGGHGRLAAVTAAVVLVVLAGAWGVAKMRSGGTTGTPAGKSIAVLPFENLSGNKENEYFSDGITEEITNALTKIPGLNVASRSVAAAEHAKGSDVRQVGQALHVDAVLSGSVQRSGDQVRISAQLVNTANGLNLWSDKYDEQLKDVFAVQDKIAKAIVSGLQLKLVGGGSGNLVKAQTENPEAHTLYLQGLYFWNQRTAATIQKAISYFEQAIKKDPGFARAYAGLALSYGALPDYQDVDTKTTMQKVTAAARKALSLDSTLAEAWSAIGLSEGKLWHNAEAETAYRHAIALDSNYATAHHWYALLLAHRGQFEEAVRQIKKARELEPLSLIINSNVGRVLYLAGRYDEAAGALKGAIDLDPNFSSAHEHLGAVYLQQRKYDEAIAELHRRIELAGSRPSQQLCMLGHAYAVSGHKDEARAILNEVLGRASHEAISYGALAMLYDGLGDHAKGLEALRTAVERFDPLLQLMSRDVRFEGLRKDPVGAELFRRTEAMQ